jgi:hypothetical protein
MVVKIVLKLQQDARCIVSFARVFDATDVLPYILGKYM